jgi:hypothetical protein
MPEVLATRQDQLLVAALMPASRGALLPPPTRILGRACAGCRCLPYNILMGIRVAPTWEEGDSRACG